MQHSKYLYDSNDLSMNRKYRFARILAFTPFLALFLFSAEAHESDDYEKALQAFNKSEYEEAYIHVRNSLQQNPNYLPAKILIGQLFLKNGLYEEAYTEFSEVIENDGDVNLVVEPWGRSLIGMRDYQQIIDFDYAKKLTPVELNKWLSLRGEACILMRTYTCAEESFNEILRKDGANIDGLNGLAAVAIKQENYIRASELVDKALGINNESAVALDIKGQILRQQGQFDEAISYLTRAFSLQPENPVISKHLVDAYISISDFNSAMNVAQKTLNQTPDDIFLMFASGWLAEQLPSAQDETSQIDKVAEKLSGLPDELFAAEPSLRYLRGMVAFLKEQYESAREDFLAYQAAVGENIQTALLLGKTYLALDDEKSALAVLEIHESKLHGDVSHALLLAGLYITQGKSFKAVPLIEVLETRYPESIDVRLMASRLLIERRRAKEGFEALDTLLEDFPESRPVLTAHAIANMQASRINAAANSVEQLSSLYPDDISVMNMKSGLLILQNRVTEAHELLDKILQDSPDLFAARFNKANVLFRLGRSDEAKALLEKLLELKPAHIQSNLLFAKITLVEGRYDDAIRMYRRLALNNKDSVAINAAILSAYLSKNDYAEALVILKKLNRLEPENPQHIAQLAQVYLKTGQRELASIEVNKLGLVGKETPSALAAQSQFWLALGDNDKALQSIRSAHQLVPNNIELHLQWIALLISTSQVTNANTELETLRKTHPDNLRVIFKQAELAQAQGQNGKAFALYQSIMNADATYDLALAKLYTLVTQGESSEAFLAIIEKVVSSQPERYFPRSLLAQYHFYYGDEKVAIKHYETILEANSAPNRFALLNRLAELHIKIDIDKSIEYSTQAYALEPQDPNVLATYGWVLALNGEFEKSLPIMRDAYLRNAVSADIRYHLAYTLHHLGQNEEASEHLEELLESSVNFSERSNAERLKDKIQSASDAASKTS